MQALLISNSTNHGEGYLDHCMPAMREFVGVRRRLAFVPFALFDRQGYTERTTARFGREEIDVRTVTADSAGHETLTWAEAVFVGGGNTFRLLRTLQEQKLLTTLRERCRHGLVYMGASAGANVACPTIRTTNDMPIVQPTSFDALGLVPFQVNPHYLDPPSGSTHMGETREERLAEFLEENPTTVVGLREGSWIRIDGRSATLGGLRAARVLKQETAPEERSPGADLSDLL